MKIKISICVDRIIETDKPIFKHLADVHRIGPYSVAPDEDYNAAIKEIEQITGIPFNAFTGEKPNVPEIFAVYDAEDGTPILEG